MGLRLRLREAAGRAAPLCWCRPHASAPSRSLASAALPSRRALSTVGWATGKPVAKRPEHQKSGLKEGEKIPIDGTWVVGCGSALVEHVQVVTSIPKAGDTVFLADPAQPRSESSVGGAMMTLLSWAATLKVPTALLGIQGADASGKMVSKAMQTHGVSDAWTVVSPEYATAENHVFAAEGNLRENFTVTGTGCTGLIDVQKMRKHFLPSLRTAGVCVAEIGAVPCASVSLLLSEASRKNLLSLLAVDVLPTTAIGEGKLGSLEELQACILQARAPPLPPQTVNPSGCAANTARRFAWRRRTC